MPRERKPDPRLKVAQDAFTEAQLAKASGDLSTLNAAWGRLSDVLTGDPEPQIPLGIDGTKLTLEKKQSFCEILRAGQSVTAAAKACKINRQTAYKHREVDPQFAAEWDAAIESGTDKLEDEAVRRALKISDTLLIFLLKGRRVQYRDRMNIVITPDDMKSAIAGSGAPLADSFHDLPIHSDERK